MKAIITYASVGSGHFKAAQAIHDYLKKECPGLEAQLIDALDKANIVFRLAYFWGYFLLAKYAPIIWQWLYAITYSYSLRNFICPRASFINRINTRAFAKAIIKENPDFIISTHFLPSDIAAYLKKTKRINSYLISVVTDFGVHPFWILDNTDFYVVAARFTKGLLIGEGVKEDRIKDFGIPIAEKFLNVYDRKNICGKLNLEEDKFTVLMVTGSFGIGPIEEIVELLYKEAQLIVVCARNKGLYQRLKRKNYPQVKVFGFVDNMQELMAVSSIIITKPGGLSISELLVMELAPIFISPIPGQETTNIEILKNYGVGLEVKDASTVKAAVLDYKEHPDKLKQIKNKIKAIKKPFATKELGNVICPGSGGATG